MESSRWLSKFRRRRKCWTLRCKNFAPKLNRHNRRPAILLELRFEFFRERFGSGSIFANRKRRRAAAGHERGQRTVRAQKCLEQAKDRKFFQRGRFERIVKTVSDGRPIIHLKF